MCGDCVILKVCNNGYDSVSLVLDINLESNELCLVVKRDYGKDGYNTIKFSPDQLAVASATYDRFVDEMLRGETQTSADLCICCGSPVPEGRQVCRSCELCGGDSERIEVPITAWQQNDRTRPSRITKRRRRKK